MNFFFSICSSACSVTKNNSNSSIKNQWGPKRLLFSTEKKKEKKEGRKRGHATGMDV
jgi:hypothetical protein